MPKIDKQMLQIYQECKNNNSDGGKKITEHEAKLLIQRAEEINTTSSSSFHSESRKGNKYLLRLVNEYPQDFSQESQKTINRYVENGVIPPSGGGAGSIASPIPGSGHPAPSAGRVPASAVPNSPGTGRHAVPVSSGHHDSGRPAAGVAPAVPNNPGTGRAVAGAGSAGSVPAPTVPTTGAGRPTAGAGSAGSVPAPTVPTTGTGRPTAGAGSAGGVSAPTTPNAPQPPVTTAPGAGSSSPAAPVTPPVMDSAGTVGPHGKVILDFTASHKTSAWHWYPMQETKPGGDPVNNLYAVGGCLDKLDQVTGKRSREYEFAHNRKAVDSGKEYAWWGHCNNASESACIFLEPKHAVVMKAQNGSEVKFSKDEIKGLLVKVSGSLISKVDFKGERFNSPSRDNPNDPSPDVFIQVMQDWAKDGLPFVLDIDRNEQVWNYPYDRVKISESDKAPDGFSASGLPQSSSTKFYHIDMSGTGFEAKKRVYECYVQRDSSGKVTGSGWIKTPNTHNNPDFMWRPHPVGDIMNKSVWQLRNRPSNPEVDPQVIYDIYMKSLG
jgi:hypothetical protein